MSVKNNNMNGKTKDRIPNETLQFMNIFQMQTLDAHTHTCRKRIKKEKFGGFVCNCTKLTYSNGEWFLFDATSTLFLWLMLNVIQ